MVLHNMLATLQMRRARETRDPRFDGKFFVGVLSTGIFCRPICSARLPKESNVTYHADAVKAIQAGYRPCKLCKPDSAPAVFNFTGAESVIQKAMQIIRDNPSHRLCDVANSLGISERYLHQTFRKQLGITPSFYKQSIQLLFAKQLLQQTPLSVTDIAIACGFQSARALQYAMRKQFTLTPSELRKSGTNKTLNNTSTIFLSYRPPYLWEPLRQFIAARSIEGIERVTANTYERHFAYGEQSGYLIAEHQADKNGFLVSLNLEDPTLIRPVIANLARVLDCHADWLNIEEGLVDAGVPVNEHIRGLRIPGVWDAFEAGCRAILGQQISVVAAIKKTRQLVALVNEQISRVGFLLPEDIKPEIVEKMGMPQTRKNTLVDFARAMQDPKIVHCVGQGDTRELLKVKGIGPWTCQYIAMRGVGQPDVWLEKDLIIIKQCEKFQINAEAAQPWRSYLTIALWHDYTESKAQQ